METVLKALALPVGVALYVTFFGYLSQLSRRRAARGERTLGQYLRSQAYFFGRHLGGKLARKRFPYIKLIRHATFKRPGQR